MKTKLLLLLYVVTACIGGVQANPPEEGRTLFLSRCAACHHVNKNLTGPALSGIDERRSMEWIIQFVQSSQQLVKSGDTTAVSLYEKFNKVIMPDHADLTVDNIKNIVEYIRSESKPGPEGKTPFAKPTKLKPGYLPISIHNYGLFTGYFLAVFALITTLYFVVRLKTFERNKKAAGMIGAQD